MHRVPAVTPGRSQPGAKALTHPALLSPPTPAGLHISQMRTEALREQVTQAEGQERGAQTPCLTAGEQLYSRNHPTDDGWNSALKIKIIKNSNEPGKYFWKS